MNILQTIRRELTRPSKWDDPKRLCILVVVILIVFSIALELWVRL